METRTRRNSLIISLAVPILLVLIAVISTLYYQSRTAAWGKENAYQVLQDSAQEQISTVNAIFDGQFTLLESFSSSLSHQSQITLQSLTTQMNAIVQVSDFLYIAVSDDSGLFYASGGRTFDAADRRYFEEAMAGNRCIQKLSESRLDPDSLMIFSVPLYTDGAITGVVGGSFSVESIQNFLYSAAFSGSAYSFLCDTQGNIVIEAEAAMLMGNTENVLDVFEQVELLDDMTVETLRANMDGGTGGVMAYEYRTDKRYAVYQPVGVNGWYLFNVIDASVVDDEAARQNRWGILSVGSVTLCSILLLLYIALGEHRRAVKLQKMQEEERLRLSTDATTGLLNERGFESAAHEALAALPPGRFCAVLDITVDNYARYCMVFGAQEGAELLRVIAQAIAEVSGETICAHLSPGRFVVLFLRSDGVEGIRRVSVRLRDRLHRLYQQNRIELCCGLYVVEDRTLPVKELCVRSMVAGMSRPEGEERLFGIYDQALHQSQIEDAMLVESMEEGLRLGQFVPFYQPKYDAATERIAGAEALVRWRRPDGEVTPPERFIRLFEQNNQIIQLDHYMFERVCKSLGEMLENGSTPVPVSVNFSRAHLYTADFPDSLLAVAQQYKVPTRLLEVEITETAFFDQRDTLVRHMTRLRELGFLVSIDDFGSGYSSLNLLKDIPFDVIKIDRGFLSETAETQRGLCVLKSVFSLAAALKVHTVAEGVETREQFELLRQYGCDAIQGYYFSRPVPEAEYLRMLAEEAAQRQDSHTECANATD